MDGGSSDGTSFGVTLPMSSEFEKLPFVKLLDNGSNSYLLPLLVVRCVGTRHPLACIILRQQGAST